MRKITYAALLSITLIAGLVVLLLLQGRSKPELARGGDRSAALDDDSLDSSPDTPSLSPGEQLAQEVGDTRLTSAAIEGATLSGTVSDDLYNPLERARVFLLREQDPFAQFGGFGFRGGSDINRLMRERVLDRGAQSGNRGIVAETVTTGDGKYAFSIAAIPRGTYRVYADHDDYAANNERWTWAPESHVIDFRLASGEVITGIVLDRKDAPIAMATVEAFPEDTGRGGRGGFGRRGGRGGGRARVSRQSEARTTTDLEGRFRLTLASGSYRLQGSADGHTPDSVSDVDAGMRDIVIVLGPSKQLLGQVRDVDGTELRGVSVALYVGSSVGRDFGRGGGGRGRGDDTSSTESSESKASERAGRWRWFSSPIATEETDARGRFLFGDVPAERYALVAEKSGYVAAQAVGDLSEPDDNEGRPEKTSETAEIVLERGAVLSGLVKEEGGDPVRGAFVALGPDGGDRGRFGGRGFGRGRGPGDEQPDDALSEADPVMFFQLQDGTETDAEGRFAFDTLPKGTYSLSVESGEHPVYRLDELVLEKNEKLDIALEEGLTLRGKVTSSRNGTPIEGASLQFTLSRWNQRSAKSTEYGEYELDGFLASVIEEVRISAPGHSTTYFRQLEVGAGEQNFELAPAAEIGGQVVNARGEPVVRARVSLSPAIDVDPADLTGGFDFRDMFRQTARQRRQESTDVDGRFRFTDLNGGQVFHITVEHPEYLRLEAEDVGVEGGQIVDDLRLVMKMGARIDVLVQKPSGNPLPGARVDVSRLLTAAEREETERRRAEREANSEGNSDARREEGIRRMVERISRGDREVTRRRSRNAGPDGKAVFAGMTAGPYLVHVEARGYQHFYAQSPARDEEITLVVASLLPENVITGRVLSSLTGEPVSGAEVTGYRETPDRTQAAAVSRSEQENRWRTRQESSGTRSSADGSFRLGGLAASTYTLRVRARGFVESRQERVQVNRDVDLAIDPLGGLAGWVRALETGLPITAFRLRLREKETSAADETAQGDPREFGQGRGRGGFDRGRFGDRWRSFEDAEGAFLVDNLQPGAYDLEVVAEGFTGSRSTVKIQSGATTEGIVVSLEEGLSVSGTVMGKGTSTPLAGAAVYLLPLVTEQAVGDEEARRDRGPGGRRGMDRQRRGGDRSRQPSPEEEAKLAFAALERTGARSQGQTTTADGAFKIPEVPEGRYELVVDHESYVPLRRIVDVTNLALTDYLLQMDPGENLSGTVTLEGHESGGGCTVIVQTADGYSKRTETDAKGRYRLTGLVPGQYTLVVRRGDEVIVQGRAVTVAAKKSNRFDYRP